MVTKIVSPALRKLGLDTGMSQVAAPAQLHQLSIFGADNRQHDAIERLVSVLMDPYTMARISKLNAALRAAKAQPRAESTAAIDDESES